MEEQEIKALLAQFAHDLFADDSKTVDKSDLKRSEQTNLKYSCRCRMCIIEAKETFISVFPNHALPAQRNEFKGFTWLLDKIGEITLENGIKLNIPDTAIFKKGKAAFLIQYQRDRSLKCVNSGERLTNTEIIKNMTNIVRNRKKEDTSYKLGKGRPNSSSLVEYGKETACIRFMGKGKDNDLEEINSRDEEGALRVMNENEFMGLMWQRPGSTFWKTIAYIQTALKCKKGIGESFIHTHIFTHLDQTEIIRHGLEDNEEIEESLFLQDKVKYCEYIFQKIYYYFEKHLGILLTQIRGEFVRDDNNRVWLINASEIKFVKINKPEEVDALEAKVLPAKINEDQLLNHLSFVAKQPKNHRTEKFSKIMNKECEKWIDASKILDIFKPTEPDIINTNAFMKLRKFTPYSLEDLLDQDKAKSLLSVYNDNKTHKKRKSQDLKGIDYDSRINTQATFSPKKITHSWIFTPKIKITPVKTYRSRPASSNVRRSDAHSMLHL